MRNRFFEMRIGLAVVSLLCAILNILICRQACAEDNAGLFDQKCAGCHTIGGGNTVGPDLSASTKWLPSDLAKSIKDMEKNVGPLTSGEVDGLVEFLKGKQSSAQASTSAKAAPGGQGQAGTPDGAPQTVPVQGAEPAGAVSGSGGSAPDTVTIQPLVEPASKERGARLFSGSEALANGGLSCIACHSIDGNGGTMSVDLSEIYKKMTPQALASACEKTPFKLMKTAYKDHPVEHQEALDLSAYLTSLKEPHEKPTETPVTLIAFLFSGIVFAVIAVGYRQRKGSAREKLQRRQ